MAIEFDYCFSLARTKVCHAENVHLVLSCPMEEACVFVCLFPLFFVYFCFASPVYVFISVLLPQLAFFFFFCPSSF